MTAENSQTSVLAAFEVLLEEMEAEIEIITQSGAKALGNRDYERAKSSIERADQATTFRDRIAGIRGEWEKATAPVNGHEDDIQRVARRDLGNLRRGVRTRESAYFQPILQVLNQMGGSGKTSDVLERVQKVMKGTLRDVDFEPLSSDANMPRWWNAAQWARNSMVQSGLLKPNSPRGVWEISETGTRMVAELNG